MVAGGGGGGGGVLVRPLRVINLKVANSKQGENKPTLLILELFPPPLSLSLCVSLTHTHTHARVHNLNSLSL